MDKPENNIYARHLKEIQVKAVVSKPLIYGGAFKISDDICFAETH